MLLDLEGKAVASLKLPTVNYGDSQKKVIMAQEGDHNSRVLVVVLYDDRGNIDVSNYSEAILNARVAGELIQSECTVDGETIYCELNEPILSSPGKVTCDITLIGKDSNEKIMKLTSQSFYISTSPSQFNDDEVINNPNYGYLISLLSKISDLEITIDAILKTLPTTPCDVEVNKNNEIVAISQLQFVEQEVI